MQSDWLAALLAHWPVQWALSIGWVLGVVFLLYVLLRAMKPAASFQGQEDRDEA